MPIRRFPRKTALLPVCLAASFAGSPLMAQERLEDQPQSTAAEPVELQSVEITASADASADGLTQPYAGEQVARGGRVGILGNRDYMETPFTSTSYTSQLIQDQQARSVSDVLQNDPSVRVARGFGNFQELYVVRGFPVYSDDISYNGLYGLLPRQYVAAEFIERVEVFRGANTFLNGAAPGGSGIGGAINILPKRAPNEPLTRLTVGAENGGQAMTHADIARRFGEKERFGVRLNAAKRAGETTVEDEDRTLDMFAVGLDYQGDNFRLSGDIGHQYHFIDNPRPSVRLNGGIPSAPDAEDNFAQTWTYSLDLLKGEADLRHLPRRVRLLRFRDRLAGRRRARRRREESFGKPARQRVWRNHRLPLRQRARGRNTHQRSGPAWSSEDWPGIAPVGRFGSDVQR